MVSGSMSCVKYLMFIMNFVFVVCGIVLIVIGAVVQTQDVTRFLDTKYVTAPTILIVIGCAIFVLAFLGCCGAVRENSCMVQTFGILLFIVFVVEIAGAATAYMYRGQFEGLLKDNMNNSIAQNKSDAHVLWDEMQTKWECCGVDGAKDYVENGLDVPKSCCDAKEDSCSVANAYPKGCYKQMLDKIKNKIAIVGGVSIGIGIVELIGVMFAWCLTSAIKKEYEGV
ncbi:CD63 antigen [Trichonephila inaurata madagascariensis]|uniref:Tetraspanin n=1 Tax=Trichonephila inaurata madagascariensis TaxID=2747483 RepID=A0A8X6MJY8_9ARAC|nr:CD63 antigen [Trichonephila inaurata madagascariensis]